ncbi:Pnap_2097 family protein [Azospirillum rugosum]|uniref:Biosynthetic protein (TIGR04099 family) n=1 Tax=Azospirillum rugosum TaxID=416170 RepID=A0ABS4SQQ3_9PROT|nr:Pnap_2097 family protein [Azospirillum rugosum]MBP2293725.1 putative biosynthetic protein (TIGR04099 family) [Azospirillum rugosum]MDQ0527270.1 putative biosynthetic protein (TIGR04099 family) [Azospirillum rugosum]
MSVIAPQPITAGLPPHRVVAGMPQLSRNGLSENWLLKECGHRHWLMLADSFGLSTPEFRDRDGGKLYATFTGVSVRDARLDRVEEHDPLLFDGDIGRVSRTQYQSVQRISVAGQTVATVAMVSIFLRRAAPGDNRSVLRALPARAPVGMEDADPGEPLAGLTLRFRRGTWERHRGFDQGAGRTLGEVALLPCPHGDFNGAGFLYFASFQSFVDRAEWALLRERSAPLVTAERELFYYGNINPGDTLTVRLCGERPESARLTHWFAIVRDSDGQRIADAFTTRRTVHAAVGIATSRPSTR